MLNDKTKNSENVILKMERLLEESFHEDTIFNSSISNFEGYFINYFGEKEFR